MNRTQFTYEDTIKIINSIGGKPIAVEAQWDGDTQGWFIMMFVIVKKGLLRKTLETHHLGNISMGGDIRVFQGTVPPYPEAKLAQEIGEKLKNKYSLEFFFPSPVYPDDNCPRWIEKERAITCEDCNKLIIPTDSPYLPKEICYNCHLKRERNESIRNEEPYDDGVNVYLFKEGEFQKIGYATKFESFTISKFLTLQNDRANFSSIQVITLDNDDIKKLIQNLENKIDFELKKYEEPQIEERMSNFVTINKVIYKGNEIQLMNRFNSHHEGISDLISSLEIAKKAEQENFQYKIYFKNGFTHRDDSILRFVNFIEKGKTNIKSVIEKYQGVLSEEEVISTINKLKKFGCLHLEADELVVTTEGKNIL